MRQMEEKTNQWNDLPWPEDIKFTEEFEVKPNSGLIFQYRLS